MSLAIPGLRGLFSLFQEALTHEHRKRIPLSATLHGFLDDLWYLAAYLAARPTRLLEVIPGDPLVIGATNASGQGMGGIAFLPTLAGPHQPILWQAPFPTTITSSLVTAVNTNGCLSILDLELAATLRQHDVIAASIDIREQTLYTLSDNMSTTTWQTRGSTTTTGAAA